MTLACDGAIHLGCLRQVGRGEVVTNIALHIRIGHMRGAIQGGAELFLRTLTARDEKDQSAEQGEDHDGHDPRHLDLRVARALDDEQHHEKTQQAKEKRDRQIVSRQMENEIEQNGQLNGNAQADQHDAGNQPAKKIHATPPFSNDGTYFVDIFSSIIPLFCEFVVNRRALFEKISLLRVTFLRQSQVA